MYVKLTDFWKQLDIKKGDTVLISSDIVRIGITAKKNKETLDLNQWIDALINEVGEQGTVIFPVFNWDFCKGIAFDYNKTPGRTGSAGETARLRNDFIRTRHPIYSFAVHGKYAESLYALNNVSGFGEDSPFDFFRQKNVKNYFVDVSLQNSFSYAHYVERLSGKVRYRKDKYFKGEYIDADGKKTVREYSSFMRNWNYKPNDILLDPLEQDFIQGGVEKKFKINNSEVKCIELGRAYDLILKDILENESRKLCFWDTVDELNIDLNNI